MKNREAIKKRFQSLFYVAGGAGISLSELGRQLGKRPSAAWLWQNVGYLPRDAERDIAVLEKYVGEIVESVYKDWKEHKETYCNDNGDN